MLPYHLPRRFRRPLLLPPGWVALGCLLLLGCLSLQAHWRQLRLANVLQLTMPPLKPDAATLTFYHDPIEYNPYTDIGTKNALVKINRMRPWHTIDFGGQPLADFFSAQVIASTVRAINADSDHAGGVRIRFRAGATYANLVKVVDIMNYTNQKRYWLDIQHHPMTLYALTKKKLPESLHESLMMRCFDNDVIRLQRMPPALPFWQRFLAAYWLTAWRLPWLLLLALGALSIYKLSRTERRLRQLK